MCVLCVFVYLFLQVPMIRSRCFFSQCLLHFVLLANSLFHSSGRNLFFIHTSMEPQMTSIQRCVVEAVAAANPTDEIFVYSNAWTSEFGTSNVALVKYSATAIFSGLELADWYSPLVSAIDLADGLRLALLFKYGGVYLDLDLIRYRILSLPSFVLK